MMQKYGLYSILLRCLSGFIRTSSLDEWPTCGVFMITLWVSSLSEFNVPARDGRKRSKADALAEDGILNPAPDKVGDPKFQEDGFFDPRDVVQVKYEMLRRVSVEKTSITDVSEQYGVSRPTFYQAKADFEEGGIAGLVPQKRGPHGPHKSHSDVLAFLIAKLSPGEPIRARELAKLVQKEFGIDVHPRTIERAVGGKKTPR
jgi:transposase